MEISDLVMLHNKASEGLCSFTWFAVNNNACPCLQLTIMHVVGTGVKIESRWFNGSIFKLGIQSPGNRRKFIMMVYAWYIPDI
jgi:hypothetical protein